MKPKPLIVPNWVLMSAAVLFSLLGTLAYLSGDRTNAIMSLAGAGIFAAALSFNYPALPIWARAMVTPILLAPFVALMLMILCVI